MIDRIEIRGVGFDLDEDIKKYVIKKVSKVEKYIPKHARQSAHMQIFLKEKMIKAKKECICEIIVVLPGERVMIKESTINIYAAVDIAETKLKNILKKYKEKHARKRVPRRLIAKIRTKRTR